MRTINREKILARVGRVLVLKGGVSPEREISLLSGQAVFRSLQNLGVDVLELDVDADPVDAIRSAEPDLVVLMLHGKGGEDGTMQGLLEIMGLPYSGSGVLASALAMDKVKSKLIWQQLGLKTAPFFELSADTDWDAAIAEFGVAVVKPVSGGSSLGVAIVDGAKSLREQFEAARGFDTRVMAEKFISGSEYSTGVLDNELFPTVQLETDRQFFDFEAKYKDEKTRIICPPRLEPTEMDKLERLVHAAYQSLGCRGLARVDVMQDEQGEFNLLELNTIPGMTEHSFVPTSAKRVGIDFEELMLRILDAEIGISEE